MTIGYSGAARIEDLIDSDQGLVSRHLFSDPEIYELAKISLKLPVEQCVVIEDSRNGLLAAKGAGLPCLITTSTYTVDEDFSEADRVVPELGDAPNINITLADLGELAAQHAPA